MNKKIAIIGTVGLPAKYGGFETLTEHLAVNKGEELDFLVYCSRRAYSLHPKDYKGVSLKYLPLNANGIQSIPYDIISIFNSLRKVDKLLILGVSGAIAIPFAKLFSKKTIITNIDGMEWKRNKWGKHAKRFLKFSERIAVKYSDVIIADNKVIQDHVFSSYGKRAKLIAYGADHTKKEFLKNGTLEEFPFLKEKYAFKVCRIEPENNIELILKAFAEFKKLNLVLVGNWSVNEYSKRLRGLYSDYENIFLLDSIYDQTKLNEIRSNCQLYVHGHSAGGTNPSLVEAMYLRLPVIAYGVNYNRETTVHEALYFKDVNSLLQILDGLTEEKLKSISCAMFTIASREYTWKKVYHEYAQTLI